MQNKEMEWEILGSRDSLTSNHSMGVLPSLPANIYQVSVLGLSGAPLTPILAQTTRSKLSPALEKVS